MITVTRAFETTAELADWITAQPHSGELVAQVGSSTLTIHYGAPTTVEDAAGEGVSFANPQDATRYWVGRIRAAANKKEDNDARTTISSQDDVTCAIADRRGRTPASAQQRGVRVVIHP